MFSFPIKLYIKDFPDACRGLFLEDNKALLKRPRYVISNVFENTKPMYVCSDTINGIIFLGNPIKVDNTFKSKWAVEESLWKYPVKKIQLLKHPINFIIPGRFRTQKVLLNHEKF